MKIYLPFNRFMMHSLINLPIVILPVLYIAVTNNTDTITMAVVLFVLLIDIALITIVLQYVRKDSIILDENHLRYGAKEKRVSLLKVVLRQYDKNKIPLNDITLASFEKDAMSIRLTTEFKEIQLNVLGFPSRHITELVQEINQRIENNHG